MSDKNQIQGDCKNLLVYAGPAVFRGDNGKIAATKFDFSRKKWQNLGFSFFSLFVSMKE